MPHGLLSSHKPSSSSIPSTTSNLTREEPEIDGGRGPDLQHRAVTIDGEHGADPELPGLRNGFGQQRDALGGDSRRSHDVELDPGGARRHTHHLLILKPGIVEMNRGEHRRHKAAVAGGNLGPNQLAGRLRRAIGCGLRRRKPSPLRHYYGPLPLCSGQDPVQPIHLAPGEVEVDAPGQLHRGRACRLPGIGYPAPGSR